MSRQYSVTTMTVVIEWNDEWQTEHEAQERVLQGFPQAIDGVPIFHVERTHGGVDPDGVPNQPRAESRVLKGRR